MTAGPEVTFYYIYKGIVMKVVIITGASSGIGLATAKEFASKGDCVVLAARNAEKLKSTVESLGQQYGQEAELENKKVPRFIAVATDVVKEEVKIILVKNYKEIFNTLFK